ncbi:oxygen-independent coproporphyrinogen-3 oxidase [Roseovarius nanhaiticus]|uniref:Coproporphyrinogen-III oxidase n=1 Tax=Roseovarius nanhaiticus TaxID=573024 RepID=A0A1N7HCD0_9RHOB|nr:oxygen-independent coproporphyrinogen III oxidase [Roseovarius nanhaiticus]SEL03683.1 oxygen-independent coproporphyrinogen-3 oxidase [Roseovarius nanhaiticus]SIS22348.1 oxygen-independent coproporphyrinogen-3 oxidase [Roseovarius nanhaiticus]
MTHLDPQLTERALAARAPRYTSYPPATQFGPSIGPDTMLEWLSLIEPHSSISLYAHIPFCRRLCWFCACRTQGTQSEAPLEPYVDALEAEADIIAAALPAGVTTSHLHLGGGTPTFLPPDLLRRLYAMLEARIPRAPGAEISVEVDPTEIDDARLDALADAGVTRASLGVQDFDPKVQAAIGRIQSFEQTKFAVDGLRARGINAINLDLLYGLPHQTHDSLMRTLDMALSLSPDRIALYGYAHVPWASKRQVMIREDHLPDGRQRLDLSLRAAERIGEAGYCAIGIDHFAKPGDTMAIAAKAGALHRNFQGYTTDGAQTLIGLGASSISRLPQGYAQNAPATAAWKARIATGRPATIRGHADTGDDVLRRAVIERLLCDFRVDPAIFGDPARVAEWTAQAAEAWQGGVSLDDTGALTILPEAHHLARMIAMEFDAYAISAQRHSAAI